MSDNPSEPIVVVMTAAGREETDRIAVMLVSKSLAACVQILPEIKSIYRWQGEITREMEILLLAKTTKDRFDDLVSSVTAIHSYETPEIIALPISAAAEPYLKWLLDSLPEGS